MNKHMSKYINKYINKHINKYINNKYTRVLKNVLKWLGTIIVGTLLFTLILIVGVIFVLLWVFALESHGLITLGFTGTLIVILLNLLFGSWFTDE